MGLDRSLAGKSSGAEARNRLAIRKYRRLASTYDVVWRLLWSHFRSRELAVALLELKPGDVVVDVGCGTGLSFPLIEEKIGPSGRIVGIEITEEMLAVAERRLAHAGWQNVDLVRAPADEAKLSAKADAVLLHLVPDLTDDPAALKNILAQVKPGATVVAVGPKWATGWHVLTNLSAALANRLYVTSFTNFGRPWRHLERYVANLQVRSIMFDGGYVAWGRTPAAGSVDARQGNGALLPGDR